MGRPASPPLDQGRRFSRLPSIYSFPALQLRFQWRAGRAVLQGHRTDRQRLFFFTSSPAIAFASSSCGSLVRAPAEQWRNREPDRPHHRVDGAGSASARGWAAAKCRYQNHRAIIAADLPPGSSVQPRAITLTRKTARRCALPADVRPG